MTIIPTAEQFTAIGKAAEDLANTFEVIKLSNFMDAKSALVFFNEQQAMMVGLNVSTQVSCGWLAEEMEHVWVYKEGFKRIRTVIIKFQADTASKELSVSTLNIRELREVIKFLEASLS